MLIVIDPGHGGEDSGAVGPGRLKESDVVLEVARRLKQKLEAAGVAVVMTRERDVAMSLRKRVEVANDRNTNFFLSIHCNAGGGNGFEVFTSPGSTAADPFATSLYKAYAAAFPNLRGRPGRGDGDPDKEARFYVLARTHCPAALFELEFIDSVRGEEFLREPHNQGAMAGALFRGIMTHGGRDIDPPAAPDIKGLKQRVQELERALREIQEELEEWTIK